MVGPVACDITDQDQSSILDQESASLLLASELWEQQNPVNCSEVRILVYDLTHLDEEGMGGVLLKAAGAVAQAYYEGRTVVLSDDPLSYGVPERDCKKEHQWDCWLKPISSCRVRGSVSSAELDDASARFGTLPRISNIRSKTERVKFDLFLADSIRARNHTDRVVYDHPLLADAALYTCPDKYRGVVPDCDRWWAGELMAYVFRLEPGLQKVLNDYTSEIGYGQAGVAMHVRRGDAIDYLPEKLVTGGGQLQSQYDWPEYLRLLDLAREELTVDDMPPQLIFLATDDKDAASQVRKRGGCSGNPSHRISPIYLIPLASPFRFRSSRPMASSLLPLNSRPPRSSSRNGGNFLGKTRRPFTAQGRRGVSLPLTW